MNFNADAGMVTKDLPEITRQVQDTGKHIEELEQTINTLQKRLNPLMSPRTLDASDEKANPLPVISPLADNLRAFSFKLYRLNSQLQDILNQLEI